MGSPNRSIIFVRNLEAIRPALLNVSKSYLPVPCYWKVTRLISTEMEYCVAPATGGALHEHLNLGCHSMTHINRDFVEAVLCISFQLPVWYKIQGGQVSDRAWL